MADTQVNWDMQIGYHGGYTSNSGYTERVSHANVLVIRVICSGYHLLIHGIAACYK